MLYVFGSFQLKDCLCKRVVVSPHLFSTLTFKVKVKSLALLLHSLSGLGLAFKDLLAVLVEL